MNAPEHPSSLGSGRYVVGRFLGEGRSKRVYHARDVRLGRDVAIAVVKLEGLPRAGVAALRREAERSGRLGEHPNVVAVYDVDVEGDIPYIVSRYVSGSTLAELFDRTPQRRLEIGRVLAIGADVCAALAHAHARGILHRALKPKRIWVAAHGAVVGDFGLAAASAQRGYTSEGPGLGSVFYTAPEQLLGKEIDARADLYALGAVLYESICGSPPFEGPGTEAVISQHLEQNPAPPSALADDVPRELDELILSLLAKRADKRPGNVRAVRATLAALARKRPPASPPRDTARPSAERALEVLDGTFVGRDQEMSRLLELLGRALDGQAQMVMVGGEAGIGKTRLARELALQAREQGAAVFWGRCHESGGVPAYWPWVQVLRGYAASTDPGTLRAQVGERAAAAAALLPELAEATGSGPTPSRAQFFQAITTLLRCAAMARPAVVILDDLHCADTPSLLVLGEVARELRDVPLLVLGSFRKDEVGADHQLVETLADLDDDEWGELVVLDGLSPLDVQALLAAGADRPLDEDGLALAGAVHREGEGNPFFVHELVRHLIETSRIEPRDGRWRGESGSIEELGVPEGIREVVSQRLAQRSRQCQRVLGIAAVVGREFSPDLVARVASLHPAEVQRSLEEARAARIVRAVTDPSGRFIFAHMLIREALYSDLSATRRALLHRKIGEALESLDAERGDRGLSELAHHYSEAGAAGDPSKAIAYGRRAGEQAMGQFAYEAAAEHFRRALRVAGGKEAELLLALGDAEWAAGVFDRSREAFHRAFEVARTLEEPRLLARAALGYGGRMGFGAGARDEVLIGLLEEALRVVGDEDPSARSRLMGRLAEALTFSAPLERRQELIAQARSVARRAGAPRVMAYVLTNAHWTLHTPENVEERLAIADEIVRLAEAAGDYDLEFDGRHWRVSDLMELGDVGAAEAEAKIWSRRAEEHRRLYPQWLVAVFGAMRRIEQADLEEAERLALEACQIGQRGKNDNAIQLLGVQLASVRREQARYHELEPGLHAFIEQFPAIPAWRCALALMYSESGRTAESRARFDELARDRFAVVPRDMFWLAAMAILSQTCVNLGDTERARELYELLLPFGERNMMLGTVASSWGSTARTLGALAALMGRPDDAARHYEHALERNARLGSELWLAHTRHEYARVLYSRRAAGDHGRAVELESRARRAAESHGLTRLLERISAEREQTPAELTSCTD